MPRSLAGTRAGPRLVTRAVAHVNSYSRVRNNGWLVSLGYIGDYGRNYLGRAVIARFALGANTAPETVYPSAVTDSGGRTLSGRHRYRMRFARGKLPPADAFWSITMYESDGYLHPNAARRYAIGPHAGAAPQRRRLTHRRDPAHASRRRGSRELAACAEGPLPHAHARLRAAPLGAQARLEAAAGGPPQSGLVRKQPARPAARRWASPTEPRGRLGTPRPWNEGQSRKRDRVVVRFAGDSGDGMQLTGSRFTDATAMVGNDLATLPDFPAEIRAPAGTPHGVSAFQIHFASRDILTPGDHPNVLVAMNPAALITNLATVEKGGTVILNEDGFTSHNLRKAGYDADPLEDDTLDGYQVFRVPMTSMTVRATEDIEGITPRDAARCKNLFALGLVSFMYGRPTEPSVAWITKKFEDDAPVRDANLAAFRAGYNFGETAELIAVTYEVAPAPAPPGIYRNVNGTQALAYGLIAAGVKSGLGLFYASYPITPASELLHALSRYRRLGVRTIQAEDEIAAASMALGAAFAGQLGVTATSGPGMDLKAETIGLAVAMELPLVVIDVQRAGPSTGMPTKTEAADLLAALYGRHGESPLPVIAPCTPSDCFHAGIEAARIAIRHRTPVILLSDTFLANSSEPWLLPDVHSLPDIDPGFATGPNQDGAFMPYLRDEQLARPWAVPGTPGLRHRIGGLEKEDGSGNISYSPENHDHMTRLRAERVARVEVPDLDVDDPDGQASLLVLGWGSSYGAIQGAARRVRREQGVSVAAAHIRHLNPLPPNLGDVLRSYERVLVPEMNMGQLVKILRAEYLVDCESYTKVDGLPIFTRDVIEEILARVGGSSNGGGA